MDLQLHEQTPCLITPGAAAEALSDNLVECLLRFPVLLANNATISLAFFSTMSIFRNEEELRQTSPDRQRLKAALFELDMTRTHEVTRLQNLQRYLLMTNSQLSELQVYRWFNLNLMIDKVNQCLGRIAAEIQLLENIYIPSYLSRPSEASGAPTNHALMGSEPVHESQDLHHPPPGLTANEQVGDPRSLGSATAEPYVTTVNPTPTAPKAEEVIRAVRKLTQHLLGIEVDREISNAIHQRRFTTLEESTAYANSASGAFQPTLDPFCPCWQDLSGSWNLALQELFLERFKSENPTLGSYEDLVRERFRQRLETLGKRIAREQVA
ncbi:hypothetical protein B0H11DRAFT_1914965 [Mycena galericulata]|nr:hypothetical protein B0H11DRAFT_1914965 [Mycena galericulata]